MGRSRGPGFARLTQGVFWAAVTLGAEDEALIREPADDRVRESAQFMQRGATLSKRAEALLGRCSGAGSGLVAQYLGHAGGGEPAQEEAQTFDDRAAIAGIGSGQERPITASPISHSQSSINTTSRPGRS